MASDQLSVIRQAVYDRINASSSDSQFDPTRVDRAINAANLRLGRVTDWHWLKVISTVVVTTTGTYDLSAVDGYRHTLLLSYQNQEIRPRSNSEMVVYQQVSPQDQPRYYNITGNTLSVVPTPSASITLDHIYLRDEDVLSGDTDTPLLPSAYTELLVLQTAITLAMSKKELPLMQALKTEYKEALKEAVDENNRTRQLLRVQADETLWGV